MSLKKYQSGIFFLTTTYCIRTKCHLKKFVLGWVSELWIFILNLTPIYFHLILYLHMWIRNQKAPEDGYNTDPDPQHWYISFIVVMCSIRKDKVASSPFFLYTPNGTVHAGIRQKKFMDKKKISLSINQKQNRHDHQCSGLSDAEPYWIRIRWPSGSETKF